MLAFVCLQGFMAFQGVREVNEPSFRNHSEVLQHEPWTTTADGMSSVARDVKLVRDV